MRIRVYGTIGQRSCGLKLNDFGNSHDDWMICTTIRAQVSMPNMLFMVIW
jgi:hypothetical protein